MKDQRIRIEMAKEAIVELGGATEVNKLIPDVSRSSIHLWKLRGIPVDKERFLRASQPDLNVWKRYPYRCGLEPK